MACNSASQFAFQRELTIMLFTLESIAMSVRARVP
jgi:hypothetical protein